MTLREIGFGATYGGTRNEALRQAEDMLEEAGLGLMVHGEDVPVPALQTNAAPGDVTRRAPIALPALTAAKLEVDRAIRQAGFDEAQLAARLGWTPKQITHLFDG